MPEPQRPLKVFLCHSSQDKPIVKELHNRLIREGWIDPWLDKEKLHLGEDFDLEIEKAIESTDAVIAFISDNAVKKTGYIQKELRLVYDAQMYRPDGELFTIPLRLEDCEPPLRFKHWHWGDYFGEEKEKTYQSLLVSLKVIHERVLRNEAIELALQKTSIKNEEYDAAEQVGGDWKEKGKGETRAGKVKDGNRKIMTTNVLIGRPIVYWFVGFSLLALVIILFSWLNRASQSVESTQESGQVPVVFTSTNTETVEPSATITPEQTSTSTDTPIPTPLPTEIMDAKGISMALIPEGGFTMGSNDFFANESPDHFVVLDAFYIDRYEVTNQDYNLCVTSGQCLPPTRRESYSIEDYYGNSFYSRYPVIYITWQMANNYCEWRLARLPTEAEWEKAARGTDGRNYPWGDSTEGTFVNYNGIVGEVKAIGSYSSGISPYRVFDMAGNVQEWVSDWYQLDYYSSISDGTKNPSGPIAGQEKVLRGGSWDAGKNFIRTTYRTSALPSSSFYNIGFRCAKSVTEDFPATPVQTETPTALETPANGFEIIALPTAVHRGGDATVTVRTQPRSACELGFVLPSGQPSAAGGLGPRTADDEGICSWTWTIAHGTNTGQGYATIIAGGTSERHMIEIK